MRIALDVDGVLANVMAPWLDYNNTIRQNIAMDEVRDWDFWKKYDISKRDFYAELNACWKDWRTIPATEDGLESSTGELSRLGTVDIVTARDPSTDPFVKEWLAHHGVKYDRYVSVASGIMKAEYDYDVFIDDSPLNAAKFVENKKRVMLYTQPWNLHLPEDRLCRVSDLAGAIKEIGASS